jgi:cell division protein FtsW
MDKLLIVAQLTLGMLGVLGVAASRPQLWGEQLISVFAGVFIAAIVSRIPVQRITKLSPFAYVATLLLLMLVPFVGVSPVGSESKRWLDLGLFTLQPSELMKVAVIAYLATFFHNHLGNWTIWRPMVVIGCAAAFIIMEPDISTALFIFVLAFAIMVAAGTTWFRLLSISTSAALVALGLVWGYLRQYSYLWDRILGWQDMRGAQLQVETISFQARQVQRTLANAGFFGVGPGRPLFVPEAHTDFIAVAIAHALGLTGVITLIILYLVIAARGMRIAAAVQGPASLLAAGATMYICGQAALNLLVASGIFPITGVVLPFVSQGSNSLISVSIAMGFLHLAYRQARSEGVPL